MTDFFDWLFGNPKPKSDLFSIPLLGHWYPVLDGLGRITIPAAMREADVEFRQGDYAPWIGKFADLHPQMNIANLQWRQLIGTTQRVRVVG